jgi:hypothetical protein
MRSFAIKLSFFFLPFTLVFGLPLAVFLRAGEFVTVESVARCQETSHVDVLYGMAYSDPVKRYKFRSVERRDPEIIALGSSRVMQFRGNWFRAPGRYFNAGGSISGVKDYRRFIEALPKGGRLRIVILGLDQWDFGPRPQNLLDSGITQFRAHDDTLNIIQRQWLQVYRDLWAEKFSLQALLAPRRHLSVGLNALINHAGFRNDGSYCYAKYSGPTLQSAKRLSFSDALDRIATGTRRLEWSEHLLSGAVTDLREFLALCERRQILVIGFLPPFPPTIADRLVASGHYKYIGEITPALAPLFTARGWALFDFTDGRSLGAFDAEFVDGLHGSEKTYLRALLVMARVVPQLAAAVDLETLERRLAASEARFEVAEH